MTLQLVRFQVHLRLEDNEFPLQTFRIQTEEVVLLEVFLKGIVVDVILLLAIPGPAVTDVTAFMSVTTVDIELIVTIEPLAAEATFRMASEASLVNSPRDVISVFLVLSQFCIGKQFVLVREHLFISRAEITG